ncbi:MAG: PQQ-binding-like beta-propeller repeat protein [Chloroflexi bacterium]|nr:PQQ-binding-like beta-propeller repeat protein [Chloroflexota bacterium]
MDRADLNMMNPRLTRRRMLVVSCGAGAAGLLGAARTASAAELLQRALAQPPALVFQPVTSTNRPARGAVSVAALPVSAGPSFGPPTDIAAGWDGTLWAIDGAGAPYRYDDAGQSWQFLGGGIDAVVPVLVATAAPATATPTDSPSATPTASATPTTEPSATPTAQASLSPTPQPSATSTAQGSATPTPQPSATATVQASATPTRQSASPTPQPSASPATAPSATATPTPGASTANGASGLRAWMAPNQAVAAATSTSTDTPNQAVAAAASTSTAVPSPPPRPSNAPLDAAQTPTPTSSGHSETPMPTSSPKSDTPTTSTGQLQAFGAAAPGALYVFRGAQVVLVSSAATATCGQLGLTPGDLIQAQGDPAIYIVAGGCQRRHVHNPVTLKAIQTISHRSVKQLASSDLQKLPAAADLPDSQADPGGFREAMQAIFGPSALDAGAIRFSPFQAADSQPTAIPTAAAASPTPSLSPSPSIVPILTSVALAPGSPRPISEVWPHLPASFALGVDGAAVFHNALYLFKAGRFVAANGGQPVVKLTDLKGWPQDAAWKDGLVDLVIGLQQPEAIALVRGDHFVLIDPAAQMVVQQGPKSLNALFDHDLLNRVKAGQVDALLCPTAFNQPVTAFAGPAVMVYADSGSAQPSSTNYLPQALGAWPAIWHPILTHAPSGRADGLWAAAHDGKVLHHDGASWYPTDGRAMAVSAGADGSVFGIGFDSAQHQLLRLDGARWNVVTQAAGPLAQISVGDAERVWVRDSSDAVHRLDHSDPKQPRLTVQPLLGQATHIDANADGTVWSCDKSGSALRLISESTATPQKVAAGGVAKVTSTSFGTAHFLVNQNGAAQVHRYDSPYVFKTSQAYNVGTVGGIANGLGHVYFVDLEGAASEGTKLHRRVIALDARTGQEVARSADQPDRLLSPPIYDADRELVYVALAPTRVDDATTAGAVQALDARDLSVKWEFHTAAGVDAQPALLGSQLCLGDRSGTVYLLDVSTQTPKVVWTWAVNDPSMAGARFRVPTPVFRNGLAFGVLLGVRRRGLQWRRARGRSLLVMYRGGWHEPSSRKRLVPQHSSAIQRRGLEPTCRSPDGARPGHI